MANLSSIANKLRALRAIAEEGSGATENERLNAAKLYAELLEKTHMDASELELREEGTRLASVEFGTRSNAITAVRGMATGIAKFTSCKCWADYRTGAIHFLGLASDADFAEWLVRSLVAHVQSEALAWSFEAEPGDAYAGDIQAFVGAASQRIGQRLKDMCAPHVPGTGLVVVRSKLIDEAFAALGISLGRAGHMTVNGRGHVIAAGQAAGDRASFARPLNGGNDTLRIGR